MYNILVTGATGFVGKNLVPYLIETGYNVIPVSSFDVELRDYEDTHKFMTYHQPDCIVHLAAKCGGIGANQEASYDFMFDNLQMGLNVIDSIHACLKKPKLIMVGSVCAYPKLTKIPFVEEDLWNGYPEETNAPYGIAKRSLIELTLAFNKQYGLNCANLIPSNMYGPFDNFDPQTSHVIPSIILKVYKAITQGKDKIYVWGTGNATREFLYVDDFCHAINLAISKDVGPTPINISNCWEISIKQLVETICDLMDYKGEIVFDDSKPDGQPRRCVSYDRASEFLGYKPKCKFENGLIKTIQWFKENKYDIDYSISTSKTNSGKHSKF